MMTANATNDPAGKSASYWATYYEAEGADPPAGDGTYPVSLNYWGYELLTDNSGGKFMSSFIPLFCRFMTKPFASAYYTQVRSCSKPFAMSYHPNPTLPCSLFRTGFTPT